MSIATTERDQNKINIAIQQLEQGRSNAVGECTLTPNTTTTTVVAPNCGEGSKPFLMPTSAHAAAEWGNGTLYRSAVSNGSFVITHANNAQTDRTFDFVCLG